MTEAAIAAGLDRGQTVAAAAVASADALVIVTDWNEYRHPDLKRIKATLKRPLVVDGRNLYDPAKMRSLGFTYLSIGRSEA